MSFRPSKATSRNPENGLVLDTRFRGCDTISSFGETYEYRSNISSTGFLAITAMIGVRLHGPRDLRVEELADPAPPGRGEVLVRVHAAGICGSDLHAYLEAKIGDTKLRRPLILGHEFAGTIEAVGENGLTNRSISLEPGMRVAVDPAQPCGSCELCRRGHPNLCLRLRFCGLFPENGCFCDKIVMPANCCFPLPKGIDHESGALSEPLGVALHAVDLAHVRVGESAVVIGAGPIGLLIVQAAKLAGMRPIFVVEPLPWRLHLAQEFGGVPIDPSLGDPLENVGSATNGRGVDIAFEAAWADQSVQLGAELVRPGGRLVLVGIPRNDELALRHSTARRKGLTILLSRRMKHAYPRAIQLLEGGQIDARALISHRFPLAKTPEAFALNSEYRDRVVKVMINM
jgi:L-iditol 2-dehydrogenase